MTTAHYDALLETALEAARREAPEAEVTLREKRLALTRFGENRIHQNVAETDHRLSVRLAHGGRVAEAETNDLSPEGVEAVLKRAGRALAHLPASDDWCGFAPAGSVLALRDAVDAETAEGDPTRRAEPVSRLTRAAAGSGLVAAGAFSTLLETLAIANTEGLSLRHARTAAEFTTVVMASDGGSGAATGAARGLSGLDVDVLGERALDTARRSGKPEALPPGVYPVVLSAEAVLELLPFIGAGLNAEAVRKGRSYVIGREAEALFHPSLTLVDDGLDLANFALPFDFEGTPKARLTLLEAGRLKALASDRETAGFTGGASTGHRADAAAFDAAIGPKVMHPVLLPGAASEAELVAGLTRGIYVSRLHYVNMMDPRNLTLTGMTRDGTFWVEDGKIVKPLKNLRFTESMLAAFADVRGVGAETALELNPYGGANRAPALSLGAFTFSGATTF